MDSQEKKEKHLKLIKNFPDSPGVYFFKSGKDIIYIGKATSLRDRVRSYFSKDILETRGPLIVKMLNEFDKIDYVTTDSVLEALIVEADLIKKYQPEANVKDKDDRSFNFVILTKEDFPRVLVVRSRELLMNNPYNVAYSYGPFPNGGQLREAMKIIRRMFPYRDDKCTPLQGRPCFNRQIGLCPGVCTGEMSKEEYAEQIKNIRLFFEGKKKQLLKNLEKQMHSFSKNHEFEKANITKRTLFGLNHIQDVSLIKDDSLKMPITFRIESYDIAHMSGEDVVGVMTVVEDGEMKNYDYRKFKIKDNPGVNDTKALSEVLNRRLAHIEWRFPNLIVVDGGKAQKNVMERILAAHHLNIPVVSVVKDERHKPKEILGDKRLLKFEKEILLANNESHRFAINYHKSIRNNVRL